VNGLGKTQLLFINHAIYLFRGILLRSEPSDKISGIKAAYLKFMFFLSPLRERIKVSGYY